MYYTAERSSKGIISPPQTLWSVSVVLQRLSSSQCSYSCLTLIKTHFSCFINVIDPGWNVDELSGEIALLFFSFYLMSTVSRETAEVKRSNKKVSVNQQHYVHTVALKAHVERHIHYLVHSFFDQIVPSLDDNVANFRLYLIPTSESHDRPPQLPQTPTPTRDGQRTGNRRE